MDDVLIIGIAGGSGSGKTTITQQIIRQLEGQVTIITHDNYYRPHHDLTYEERTLLNFDHPDAYETELLIEHLAALRRGETVRIPVYDFTLHDRSDRTLTVHPSRITLVEGILLFANPRLRDMLDIKVYVDCDADLRILRRVMRDVEERGRSLESVVNQYLATVKPMHEAFVEPSKRFADIIIPTMEDNPIALDMLIACIQSYLSNTERTQTKP